MMNFLPSKDDSTIAVEFEGKATKEDAQKLDERAKENFGDDRKFNIFALIHDVDGSTLKGMAEGFKTDAKHWKQYRKIAVVSDRDWIKKAGSLGDYLPGIEVKHFEKSQQDEAWKWIMQ